MTSNSKIVLFFSLFIFSLVFEGKAQIVKNPIYARKDSRSMQISEIQILPDKTIIIGEYTNIEHYGWANITNTTFIRDCATNQKYKIISSTGLPLSPTKHTFTRQNEVVTFKMIFPAINNSIKKIDLIEDESSYDGFNVYEIGLDKNLSREFVVKEIKGQNFTNKPSFRDRICGVKEIQILIPKSPKNIDKYVFGHFQRYIHLLGLKTDIVTANYEGQDLRMGTVSAYNQRINDSAENYTTEANILRAAISYTTYFGNYVGGTDINIIFVDPTNAYTWEYKMKLPNKAEKYIKELQNTICNFYSYNPQYSVILPSKVSNYNAIIMKDDIAKNGCDLVEGIYKGDYYTIGLKKSKDTYYLIYFEGADNSNWKEGDIKASLTATATPGLYKAIWFGAWKQKMDMTVIFSEGLMTVIDENKEKEIYIKTYPTYDMLPKQEQDSKWSGTGFFLTHNGYIVTNQHVIDGAKELKVTGINGDYKTNYNARVEVTDEHNDLAIIKITDSNFKSFASLPYAIRKTNANIGEDCFVLGYPLISTMGMDIKLTNGIISAKTGYQADVSQNQISAPIQPGNSGGPLFDKNGNLIGIVCAKHTEAENAGYAIKVSYLNNLADALSESIVLPQNNRLIGKTLPDQVKIASNYVCVILAE